MSEATEPRAANSIFAKVFLDHPASVDESYFAHMRFALRFSFWLSVAAGAALIHALVPACCETTASRILGRLTQMMESRH